MSCVQHTARAHRGRERRREKGVREHSTQSKLARRGRGELAVHTLAILPFFTSYRREDASFMYCSLYTTLGMGKQQVNSEEENLRCPKGERNTVLTSSRSFVDSNVRRTFVASTFEEKKMKCMHEKRFPLLTVLSPSLGFEPTTSCKSAFELHSRC